MFVLELAEALKKSKVAYALVGGYAVALHGAVRGTVDLDIVIALDPKNIENLEQVLKALGLISRLPISHKEVSSFREEYIAKRNLVAWNFYSPKDPTKIVDVVLTHDLNKMKTVKKRIAKKEIIVVSVDDLIAMKKLSARPQDLIDIAALERIHK